MAKVEQHALRSVRYDDLPGVLVLADSEAGEERLRTCAEGAGFRVTATIPFEQGVERLRNQARSDAILLDVERDHGSPLDRLLDWLNDAGRSSGRKSVVTARAALIDVVAARTSHGAVRHLCEPTAMELQLAIAEAGASTTPRFHDVEKGKGALHHLSQEVERIASMLAQLSEGENIEAASAGAEPELEIDATCIRAMIRARRMRDQYFPAGMFADPAWDMLLDLMAARLERQRVAVSSLCIAAAVPPTTALRWINTLTDHGLFVRVADPNDGRRVFIELSEQAASRMLACLRAMGARA